MMICANKTKNICMEKPWLPSPTSSLSQLIGQTCPVQQGVAIITALDIFFRRQLYIFFLFLSPSGDLGIGLVWDNPTPPHPGPDRLFGPTVEILFKLNLII